MHSIPQTQVDCAEQKHGVVIFLNPTLKSTKLRSQPCIFCGTTVQIQTFKGKAVCSSCCQHIPNLFIQRRVQHF
jgi:hypothetical protein